jgi:hypothetical protein
MKPTTRNSLALLASAIALCLSASASADPGSYGHPHTQTHLSANLADAQGSGRGEVAWVSDAASGKVIIQSGITLPVGSAAYGLTDSNAAVAAAVTLNITHGSTVYTCSLHVEELYFKPPTAQNANYAEFGNYKLLVAEKAGAPVGISFGSCSNFPAQLSANDAVTVTVGTNTLTGVLK